MNKESNLYTFTFAIIMVLIVGTGLAITSEVLQPRKKQNAADKKMIDILSAIGIDASRSEAKEIIDSYFTEFKLVKEYMDNSIKKAKDKKYVETILGRKRYLRDIDSRNFTLRGFAERNAINSPIQGSAADIIKSAMIKISDWMRTEDLKSKMIMQVHDELVFDVVKSEKDKMEKNVKKIMENIIEFDVPLTVEIGTGKTWLEAH